MFSIVTQLEIEETRFEILSLMIEVIDIEYKRDILLLKDIYEIRIEQGNVHKIYSLKDFIHIIQKSIFIAPKN